MARNSTTFAISRGQPVTFQGSAFVHAVLLEGAAGFEAFGHGVSGGDRVGVHAVRGRRYAARQRVYSWTAAFAVQ